MQHLFMEEGAKYHVQPIDPRYVESFNAEIAWRPELLAGRTSMTLYEGMSLPGPHALIGTKNKSFTIVSTIEAPDGKPAEGVLLANAGLTGGWVLFVKRANRRSTGITSCRSITPSRRPKRSRPASMS